MKTKSFYDIVEKRLTKEQIAEIERKAQLESELILAAIAKDDTSVRKLAEIAKVSPTIVQSQKIQNIMTKNKHIGSSFDDFLQEQGILEEVELTAIEMVIAEKTMNRKTFQEYLKERLNEDEIGEIKQQALQEYNVLKAQEK